MQYKIRLSNCSKSNQGVSEIRLDKRYHLDLNSYGPEMGRGAEESTKDKKAEKEQGIESNIF